MSNPLSGPMSNPRLNAPLDHARRGWPVFPIHNPEGGGCSCADLCSSPCKHPRTPHGLKDATTDPEQIRKWWTLWPEANNAHVTGADSGIVAVDLDGPIGQAAFMERCGGELPKTVTVRTGRGLQLYFAHPGYTVGNRAGVLPQVDIRGDGGYVVGEGSGHINGKTYEYIVSPDEAELAPLPEWLLEAPLPEPKAKGLVEHPITEGGRNDHLYRFIRSHVARGDRPEVVRAAARAENLAACSPPLSDTEVTKIIEHALTQPDRPDFAKASAAAGTAPLNPPKTVEPALSLEAPEEGIVGLGRDFANFYSQYLESPRSFLYFGFLTYYGALASRYITLDSALDVQPRLYTVLIGESGSTRKSTAILKTKDFFAPLIAMQPPETPPLFCLDGLGSAEGLAEQINKHVLSGRDPRSVPFIICYDELRAFVMKAQIRSSVLLEMMNTFFETGSFGNVVTSKADGSGGIVQVHDASVSLLGASTLETYASMFDQAFLTIGFPNRLWAVRDRTSKSLSLPPAIPADHVSALRQRVAESIRKLHDAYAKNGHHAVAYPITPDARTIFDEWYQTRGDSVLVTRLDTYGHRLALLLTAITGKKEVDAEIMHGVVSLLRWQLAVRVECDPIDADSNIAKVEEKIRRALDRGGLADADLKKKCNASRCGTYMWGTALKNLSNAGEIQKAIVGNRPGWRKS